ncbi:MAG: cbb3-type cytochrome c oxidase subunit I [Candidatus Didemnitutus sp.]|nr:cbb3-type cytochrome c oxidase subunit I [Candidatus Didemnitutus sp.]
MNSPDNNDRVEQQEIDASAKWPVLVFFSQALAWLVIGGALQLIAAIQLHTPDFLANCEWFTYGRVTAAAQNVLVYGWGFNAGLGVALWLMARLSAAALRHGGWLIVACKAWNIAVGLGMLAILMGGTTSYELLEMPRWITFMLLGAYALMGVWAITTFSVRNTENVFASQWYIFGAMFWFPWLYAVAQTMLFSAPTGGVVQAIVNVWYVNGIYGLWFIPLALAAIYYFLPKITGKPIHDYYLAKLAFWWLVLTTAFAGGSRLIGGPVPAWVATLGTVANFMLVVAVVMVLKSLLGTLRGNTAALKHSMTLKFILVSILGFTVASILNFALSVRGFAMTTQFTLIPELRDWVILYACFSTAMFGAVYFVVPRLLGVAWQSNGLIKAHYYTAATGMLVVAVALGYGGWQQGHLLNATTASFGEINTALKPWLMFRSVGLMILLTGHLAFVINCLWTLGVALIGTGAPAVFRNPPAIAGAVGEGGHS